jgi:hypothetical protein
MNQLFLLHKLEPFKEDDPFAPDVLDRIGGLGTTMRKVKFSQSPLKRIFRKKRGNKKKIAIESRRKNRT